MKRAEIAPLTSYVKSLTSLRQQFAREANFEAVAVVEAEIKTMTEELTAAIKATDITAAAPVQLRIDQALFGDFKTNRTADVTSYIQNGFASGTPTVVIRGSAMLGAHDPAPGVTKSLKVIYTFNGKRKEKTFNTGETPELDFKRDLK